MKQPSALADEGKRRRLIDATDILKDKFGEGAVVFGHELRNAGNTTGSSSKTPPTTGNRSDGRRMSSPTADTPWRAADELAALHNSPASRQKGTARARCARTPARTAIQILLPEPEAFALVELEDLLSEMISAQPDASSHLGRNVRPEIERVRAHATVERGIGVFQIRPDLITLLLVFPRVAHAQNTEQMHIIIDR